MRMALSTPGAASSISRQGVTSPTPTAPQHNSTNTVAGNVFRITTVAMISRVFGREIALTIHDKVSGFIVFSVAVICLLGASRVLNTNFRAN